MAKLILILAVGAGIFYALHYYQPGWAASMVQIGGVQVSWSWIVILAGMIFAWYLAKK